MSFDPGNVLDVTWPLYDTSHLTLKNILILSIMWQFLLLAMLAIIAVLVIRKQQKKSPRDAASKQLIEKQDIADVFGEDLLDTFKTR